MVFWMVCKRDDENAKRKQAKKKNGITEFKESTTTDHAVKTIIIR